MKKNYVFFLLLNAITYIKSDWVEITQASAINQKLPKVNFVYQSTTPSSYEILMKTPRSWNEFETTTMTNFKSGIDQIDHDINENIYTATTSRIEIQSSVNNDIVKPFKKSPENVEKINSTDSEADTIEYYEEEFEEDVDEDNKSASSLSYNGILPFLKNVQKTLLQNKAKSVFSKISVLTHLRDHLLSEIQRRISSLWKSEPIGSEPRGYKDEDTHMEFPSNEGALMTIGFLTFAVFLIKLVLKLIYALKYKQQYYNTMTVAPTTTGAAATFFGRKKRDTYQDAIKFLQFIEEYKFN